MRLAGLATALLVFLLAARLETLQLWLEKKKETHELVERISFRHETTAKKDAW